MTMRGRGPLKSVVALILTLLLTFGQVLPVLPLQTVQAAQPILTITGTGLHQDILIYEDDWAGYDMVERFYSSNNNYDYHKIWKVKGYDIFDLIGEGNLKTDDDYEVAFISARDGGRVTKTVSELQSQYYHPQFTEDGAELVAPMLSFYRTAVFEPDYQRLPQPDEVVWEDRVLTEADADLDAPRLVTGQPFGQVSQNNQSFFNKEVGRIVVGEERPAEEPIDFDNSPYKHISYDGAPYNVDTYTGATMTVEGPGVHNYNALSMRQLEEVPAAGLYRGSYLEDIEGEDVESSYEGVRISYILDNFITLKPTAGKVVFKNYQRQVIAEYTLEEIRDEGRAFVAAYGVEEVPLVYYNTDDGYVAEKRNDGGCLKLASRLPGGGAASAFDSLGYIYVEEMDTPGFEHNKVPYDDPALTQYIFSVSGSGLGKEVNYTTAALEAMTELHLEKEYSSSNSEYYWYYNSYKGIPLWDLLLKAGLDPDIDEETSVRFVAADHYSIPDLTVGDVKHHDRWGYYEKSALDMGDGTFDGSGVEPIDTGYPVLLAYGVNGYPYVKNAGDPGFNSGLGNRGGPLRIIFGKKDYDHTNGSQQVKYALRVIVGEDLPFTTHSYAPYDELAGETLSITVLGEDGAMLKEEALTVGQLEELIYGADVPAATADHIRAKGYYNIGGYSDLYEGIALNYLLFEKIGLPGTMGTVTLSGGDSGEDTLELSLAEITRTDYFNENTGVRGLKPMLAFAKNGYPLVVAKGDNGYVGSGIVNRYGPLMAVFGQTAVDTPGQELRTVKAITVEMSTDPCAHLQPPYDQYAGDELHISGSGVRNGHTVTVGELEFMQNYILTGEYCLAKSETNKESALFRGLDIYEYLLREVGFTAGADQITFRATDGFERTFDLEEISKNDYINEETGADNLRVMLAFGKSEVPLVPEKSSGGYVADVGNHGGPLYLIVGQSEAGDLNSGKLVKNVSEIIVDAVAGDSWKHDRGLYTQYLDWPVLRITGSQVAASRTFTLRELQALDEHIIRDTYMSDTEIEGIVLWDLIKDVVGLAEGVTTPSSVRVYSGPDYNQIQSTADVMNGVLNSVGLTKEIILGYAIKGYPLVPDASSPGYMGTNQYGPLRLIVEENNSLWTKNVDCIVVGTGGYEEPLEGDLPADPAVFAVSGDGVSGALQAYTLDELKALGESSGSYSYSSKGAVRTDQCTGVLLADILAALGVTNPAWEIELLAADGYEHESYVVSLQTVIDDGYLLTYLVNGAPVDPEGIELHIYRHHDDGSTWLNRAREISGVRVKKYVQKIALPAPGTADEPAQVVVEVGAVTDFYLDLSAMDVDKYALTMIVPAGTETPSLKFNTVEAGGGNQAVLPAISLKCNLFIEGAWQLVEVDIPAGTIVTGSVYWDGVLHFPAVQEKPSVSIDGIVGAVIEIGLLDSELLFDQAVRLSFPGQVGKKVGFVQNDRFVEITRTLAKDDQAYADDEVPWGGAGKIGVGPDLVVWTKHFTQFVTYAEKEQAVDKEIKEDELPRTGGSSSPAVFFVLAALLLCVGMALYFRRRETV